MTMRCFNQAVHDSTTRWSRLPFMGLTGRSRRFVANLSHQGERKKIGKKMNE